MTKKNCLKRKLSFSPFHRGQQSLYLGGQTLRTPFPALARWCTGSARTHRGRPTALERRGRRCDDDGSTLENGCNQTKFSFDWCNLKAHLHVISDANFNKLVHLLKIKLFFFSLKTHKSIAKSDLGTTSSISEEMVCDQFDV
jgi:hypothetical protein